MLNGQLTGKMIAKWTLIASLLGAGIGCVSGFYAPEFRRLLGLDSPPHTWTKPPVAGRNRKPRKHRERSAVAVLKALPADPCATKENSDEREVSTNANTLTINVNTAPVDSSTDTVNANISPANTNTTPANANTGTINVNAPPNGNIETVNSTSSSGVTIRSYLKNSRATISAWHDAKN